MTLLMRFFSRIGWRGGLLWFVISLAVCVSSVFSVQLVAERLGQSLKVSGRNFLAADVVLQSGQSIPASFRAKATELGISDALTVEFSSMLITGDQMQLASIKAVENNYPFYGSLQLYPSEKVIPHGIWLSDTLMKLLQMKSGQTLTLGNTHLVVKGLLIDEPDQSFNPFSLAPRAVMHVDDLAAAEVLMPGSRATYRLLLHGNAQSIEHFITWVQPKLQTGDQVIRPEQANKNLSQQLVSAERFFRLASLIAVLLGGMAMYIATDYFSRKTRMMTALLKSLGASRNQIIKLIGGMLMLLSMIGVIAGLAGGWALHHLMISLLGTAIPADLAPISNFVFIKAFLSAMVLALLLICMPVIRLIAVPAMQVLRSEDNESWSHWIVLPIILVFITLMNSLVLNDIKTMLALVGGMLLLLSLLACVGWGILRLLPQGKLGSAYHLSVQPWIRHPLSLLTQLTTIALPLLLVGVVLSVRAEIFTGFHSFLPADAPNRFLINISDFERSDVETFLNQRSIAHSDFYPIVRGRLIAINQQKVTQNDREQGRKGIHRELTMTAQAKLPDYAPVVSGQAWDAKLTNQVSISDNVARDLDIHVGDKLSFTVDGQPFEVTVRNIREVDWQSMRPNFFMIFTPDVFHSMIVNWMTSYRLPLSEMNTDVELAKQFPTVTLLNIDSILEKLEGVLNQLSQAVSVLMVLVVIAGVLVLIVQWMSRMQQRQRHLSLLRIFGAGNRQLRQLLYWQATILGLLAGVVAAVGTEFIRWVLQQQWSTQPWQLLPSIWGILPLLGFTIVVLISHVILQPLLQKTLSEKIRSG